uniref:Serine/threonine-protein kinase At5g01020 isoform X2 n=1 Tax=Rhizophora mucronata TaxID=61149 RepID=A0A2P2K6D6_RHIMU
MKCRRKSRFRLRSIFMGICFSIEQDHHQLSLEHHQLSSKGSHRQGHDSDQSPSKLNRPDSSRVQSLSPTLSVPRDVTDLRQNPGYTNVDIFTYEEMTLATKHFRPDFILGEGGFGVVYKGVINGSIRPGCETTYVAIKELNPDGLQGDREWLVFALSCVLIYLFLRRNVLVLSI